MKIQGNVLGHKTTVHGNDAMMNFMKNKIRLEAQADFLFPGHEFDALRVCRDLRPTLSFPYDCSSDKFTVKTHIFKAGDKASVVNFRDAIYMRMRACEIIFTNPFFMHTLERKGGGVMIATHPQEIFQMSFGYDNAFGRVLVGGLGLGYIATKIAKKRCVKKVTVVEKDADLIKFITPFLDMDKLEIINDDLFLYLKKIQRSKAQKDFDYGYFDIWYGRGGEGDFQKFVVPLRIAAHKAFGDGFKMNCWAEETMKYQVMQSCVSAFLVKERQHYDHFDIPWVFKHGCSRSWRESIAAFFKGIGTAEWRSRWKWEAQCMERKKLSGGKDIKNGGSKGR